MTRIIAGAWGGRRLEVPSGDGTRPTTDRVRESLFSALTSQLGGFDGLVVADLFAGSGAVGLEAASRGAVRVDLVESDRRASSVIGRNIAALGARQARVHRIAAHAYVSRPASCVYDVIFLDPPYGLAADSVREIVAATEPWRADDCLIVVERSSRDHWQWPSGTDGVRTKRYGETTLWYGR